MASVERTLQRLGLKVPVIAGTGHNHHSIVCPASQPQDQYTHCSVRKACQRLDSDPNEMVSLAAGSRCIAACRYSVPEEGETSKTGGRRQRGWIGHH